MMERRVKRMLERNGLEGNVLGRAEERKVMKWKWTSLMKGPLFLLGVEEEEGRLEEEGGVVILRISLPLHRLLPQVSRCWAVHKAHGMAPPPRSGICSLCRDKVSLPVGKERGEAWTYGASTMSWDAHHSRLAESSLGPAMAQGNGKLGGHVCGERPVKMIQEKRSCGDVTPWDFWLW